MDSFFSELRRRNVLRLAATYALVAWILIEAGSVLLPTFGVPDWFFRAWVIAIFIGFIIALILAWVFEVTPEGVKFDREVDRSREQPRNRGRSNAIIIALLVIALGVSITFNVTDIRTSPETPATSSSPGNSVAVLPFTSRSTDPENQYFADGMHDDLLARLAGIDSLRVISRTSVNEYRDTTKNLREIGEELGVATVVEGAVQRFGDQVRINVQLVNAATDEPIWGETYDRALTAGNLFQIQSDISSQVAAALQAALTPEQQIRLAARPTESIEALSLYSAARNNLYLRRFDSLLEAREQFEQAIEIDPEYAQAYAGLAETVLVLVSNHNAIPTNEANRIASTAIERALALDPSLAEAYAVKGLYEYSQYKMTRVGNENLRAAAAFEKAIALNPNLANAYVWFALLREGEGNIESAVDLLTTAMEIDPLGRIAYINLPNYYAMLGKHDKAIQLLLKSMAIFPDWATPYVVMADHLIGLGRLDESLAWSNAAVSMTDDPLIGKDAVRVYVEFGQSEKIAEFTAGFPKDHPMYPIGIGFRQFMNNDFESAIESLEQIANVPDAQAEVTYPLIALSAAIVGDYEKSRDYLLRANPRLSSDTNLGVDRYNLRASILLAFINRKLGRDREASELLTQAWDVMQDMPRLGFAGYGISDVHILAIQGRKEAALDALRTAIDEGFVSLVSHEIWTLDQDILIDNLRDEPRFEQMRQELHQIIERMRESARRAEESGDWSILRDRVRNQLTAALRP